MTDLELEKGIRDAFDSDHVANPGLEDRVIAALPWTKSATERRKRIAWTPRLAAGIAILVTVGVIVALVGPAIAGRLLTFVPGGIGSGEPPAYSMAAATGDHVFVVQRGEKNVLLVTTDNGRTWKPSLLFDGVYLGTQMFGADGFVSAVDMQLTGCDSSGGGCDAPSQSMALYRTHNSGKTWIGMPATTFPVEDVFFLDAMHGWADSAGPGLNPQVLYSTDDGGASWTRVGSLPVDAPMGYVYGSAIYRVTFSKDPDGSLRGWYMGAANLYTSTDGGRSWQPVRLAEPEAVKGWIATPQQPVFGDAGGGISAPAGVIVVGYRNPQSEDNVGAQSIYLYRSRDGGKTWGPPVAGPANFAPVGDIFSVAVLDPQHIWLTSQSLTGGDNVQTGPEVARTSDAGRTWTVTRNSPRILTMMFLDPLRGFGLDVSGPTNVNGIVRTTDGGATWQRLTLPVFTTMT
jgi:photosystem II stability/assembly factor-like uncharacterized protein